MRTKAFTLIELLVVIAIIAVLMAILMPSLRLAKDHATRLQCIANVKTLSLAWLMYKDANDDKMVGAMINDDEYAWAHGVPSGNATVEQEIDRAIRQGAPFPYVSKTVEVYRSPADQRMKDPRQTAYRSFSIANGANGETGWPDGGNDHRPAQKYGDIKNPSLKYVFLEDIDPRGSNVGSWQFHFQPLAWIDPVAMWHKRQTTLGYADGHSEMHRWNDQSLIEWCQEAMYEPMGFSFNMTPPGDELGDIIFMRDGFPCKSHRQSRYYRDKGLAACSPGGDPQPFAIPPVNCAATDAVAALIFSGSPR
jgi:prepilin-type N-terminal cleavage/methylation domain-containing protein